MHNDHKFESNYQILVIVSTDSMFLTNLRVARGGMAGSARHVLGILLEMNRVRTKHIMGVACVPKISTKSADRFCMAIIRIQPYRRYKLDKTTTTTTANARILLVAHFASYECELRLSPSLFIEHRVSRQK